MYCDVSWSPHSVHRSSDGTGQVAYSSVKRNRSPFSATPSSARKKSRAALVGVRNSVGGGGSVRWRKGVKRERHPLQEAVLDAVFGEGGASPTAKQGRNSRSQPSREGIDMDVARYNLTSTKEHDTAMDPLESVIGTYRHTLISNLFDDASVRDAVQTGSVLSMLDGEHSEVPPVEPPASVLQFSDPRSRKQTSSRILPQVADRVLDAPCIIDDFRLHSIDWSSWANVLAVALNDTVYTWEASTGVSSELLSMENDANPVSCVSWIQEGGVLAMGTTLDGCVKLWDMSRGKTLRQMDGHSRRVCAMAWNHHILTTGSQDGTIVHHDVRVKKHKVAVLRGHRSEVCSLHYSPDCSVLSSSCDDGKVVLWDAAPSVTQPKLTIDAHEGPVKAVSWIPCQRHTLATGGFGDRSVRIWNTVSGDCFSSTNTESEVTSLLWADSTNELVTGLGHPGDSLMLWRFRKPGKLTKVADVKGHNERVLHTAMSPDGQTVVSSSADETIRFWRLFEEPKKKRKPVQLALR